MEIALHWGFVSYFLRTTATMDEISFKTFTPFIVVLVKNDLTNNKKVFSTYPMRKILCYVHEKCQQSRGPDKEGWD